MAYRSDYRSFFLPLLMLLAVNAGCGYLQRSPPSHDAGVELMAQGRYEEGLSQLERAAKEQPGNLKIRTDLINLKEQAIARLLAAAADERTAGHLRSAGEIYQRVMKIDSTSERARAGLVEMERDRRHADILQEGQDQLAKGNGEAALARAIAVLKENPANGGARELKRRIDDLRARELASIPTLRSIYAGPPVNLDFRDANLRLVLEALSRTTGVTFIFDRDVKADLRTTILARQTSFEDAVDLILMTGQLEKKIVNRNTVLVYPATAQKLREYQDLVVKGFSLNYADVKQTQNLLTKVLKVKDMFVDEKMNLIVLRDTPDTIRLAEKLIAMHDLVAPEVMLDLEVIEVQRNKLLQMGIQWPNQLTLSPLPTTGTTTTLKDLSGITASTTSASLTNAIINLTKQAGVVNLLANPRIRAQNHEKARILIGDKVPVITTTSTATGFASQSVQYLDVGLKLEIEPSIFIQDEVAIRMSLEVSSITNAIQTASGVLTYQIGTRTASTMLRLKDGETQVLAGLISDQDRITTSGIPGLGDMPIAGRLFRSQKDDLQKTEIVLSITPRLVRNSALPDANISEFLSGSEANPRSPRAFAAIEPDLPATKVASASPSMVPPASPVASQNVGSGGGAILAWNGPSQVRVGETFKVAVALKSNSHLRSVPLQIGYDATSLDVVEISEGGYFRQGGAKSSFASNIDAAGGRIFIGVSRSEGDGVTGDAEVVTVTLRAKAPQAKVEFRILAATAVGAAGVAANVSVPSPMVVSISK